MDTESLIDGSEDAKQFIAESAANPQEFLLYPSEEFEEIEPVCLGSTGIDLQGETTTHGDLERIVERISAGPFWTTLYHDPTIHPVGRILTAKIFEHQPSGRHFVTALVGSYNRAKLPLLSEKLDAHAKTDLDFISGAGTERAYLSFNPFEMPFSLVEELVSEAPLTVDRRVQQERRKSAEAAVAILRLVIPAGLFFGMAKKAGEKTVELVTEELFSWIKTKVVAVLSAWSRENNRRTLFILETEINGCQIEFVTSLQKETERIDAASTAFKAFDESISIVQQFVANEPTRLVLEYDEASKRWLPLYLVTRHGVFTDRPYLEAIRARGLSLASRSIEFGTESLGYGSPS